MTHKALTEQDVQEFCNRFGVFVAVDENKSVHFFKYEPSNCYANGLWSFWGPQDRSGCCEMDIRISSTRPWTEQIWRPE